ncbi:MAG: hypothetical protein ACE5KM_17425 [Planctomycetaceae bacterium]
MTDRTDDLDWVGLVCPVCGTRLHARVADEPGEAECPDCFTLVRVPPREEVLAARPPEHIRDDPGAYTIAIDGDAPRRPPTPTAQTEFATIQCPQCGGHLTPELRERPWNMTCPDCLEVVEVPSRDAWRKPHAKKKTKKRRAPPSAGYAIGDPPPTIDRGDPFATGLFDALAEIHSEPPPPVPRWTFFTGVFGVPWRSDVRTRWVYLSIGFAVLGFLAAILTWLAVGGGFIAVPFFVLPAIWVGIWTGSYAGTCFLTIVEDTANGNDRIANWNDGGWRDWAADALRPLYLAALVGAISYFVGRGAVPAMGDGLFWPAFGVTFWLGFPFALLSSMQAGSVWTPFSVPVLRTTYRKAWAWLVYYLLASAVAAVYLLPLLAGLKSGSYFLTLIGTAPLAGAVLFVHARLLGRLAWRVLIFDAEIDMPPRRRRGLRSKHKSEWNRDEKRPSQGRIGSPA